MTLHRRSFLTGLGAVVAAPAIVRASSLMRINPRLCPWPVIRDMPASFQPDIDVEHDFLHDKSLAKTYIRGQFGAQAVVVALGLELADNSFRPRISAEEERRLRTAAWKSLEVQRAGREVEFIDRAAFLAA